VRREAPDVALALVTAERTPLAAFGAAAGGLAERLLAAAGIELRTGVEAEELARGELSLGPEGAFAVERAIALPRLAGPRPRGIPCEPHGFVPVDELTRARGIECLYAIGDVAATTVKQGALATQQADVAATAIAAAAGAAVRPEPYRPVLRGMLLTGTSVHYMRNDAVRGSEVSGEPLWWPPGKVAGRHLGAYLASHLDIAVSRAAPPVAA
jgi:sulfide:quinone oxidoreductase